MGPIPDYIKKHLEILFIGFNPSIKSGETGHHFASPNNRFWTILFQAGLTPTKLSAEEDVSLLKYGYGLTNIVARPTKAADDITKDEYREGRQILLKKLEMYKPRVACYVGKGVYQEIAGKKQVPWGWQERPVVAGVKDFVAPSSSGLVRMRLNEIVTIYKMLLEYKQN